MKVSDGLQLVRMSRFALAAALLFLLPLKTGFASTRGCDSPAGEYLPYRPPIVQSETTDPTDVYVIVMHGKNGSPYFANLLALYDELNARGYRTIAPVMPWGGQWTYNLDTGQYDVEFIWDGTRCEGLAYLESLIETERQQNRRVILMGHSFGGNHMLMYSYLNTTDNLEAIVTIAPGHILPYSTRVIDETAPSRSRAKALIAQGLGDVATTFQTLNTGGLQTITATPRVYLSFHEPDPDLVPDRETFPDMSGAFPNIDEPVQWLVGAADPIIDFYNRRGFFGMLPPTPENEYRVIDGDHLSVLLNVADETDRWFRSWSSLNPADSDADGTPDIDDAFPDDQAEDTDTDEDGLGNNTDTDDDGDGIPDAYEEQNGLDRLDPADAAADFDSDGESNLVEYQNDTDPRDMGSSLRARTSVLVSIIELLFK